jgi:hypothetical protein
MGPCAKTSTPISKTTSQRSSRTTLPSWQLFIFSRTTVKFCKTSMASSQSRKASTSSSTISAPKQSSTLPWTTATPPSKVSVPSITTSWIVNAPGRTKPPSTTSKSWQFPLKIWATRRCRQFQTTCGTQKCATINMAHFMYPMPRISLSSSSASLPQTRSTLSLTRSIKTGHELQQSQSVRLDYKEQWFSISSQI